ncbi:MAG: Bug family tripartite tricarboxylate transporter substrate binding protein [Burkholderiales bacterium]
MITHRPCLNRIALSILAACTAALPAFAIAQAWPAKPLTLVVPFPAGGPTDASARIIGKALAAPLGQSVVVENRPGAGGTVGSAYAAKAAPDGYTLLWGGASTLAVAPALFPQLSYDPLKSFAHISFVSRSPHLLVGRTTLAPRTLRDLVTAAKAKPGGLNYGSAGNGSATHLTGELFKSTLGVDLVHIPYKGGGPALNDLLGGQIDLVFDAIPTLLPHIKSGRISAYAITGRKRDPLLPDVPTVTEALGVDFDAYSWFGLVAPAGTPAAITQRLSKDVEAILREKDVREQLGNSGFEVVGTTPEQFRDIISAELKKWTAVVKAARISAE